MTNITSTTKLHVINHTHWDREWFVPYTFTRRWIPKLITNLEAVVADNPTYKFLFDAQTMVIEDLKDHDAACYATACRLIREKNLEIGPYYAQIDQRMSGPESLIRNLRTGIDKVRELGGSTDFTAWDVDIFGQVSQSPQIHGLFGIDNVYLWRGPSKLEPFFWWCGPDGTSMLAIDLFAGGYRNFYRVTTKDRLALPRLQHEVRKLRPYYASGHIPVFDGFDLDSEPGDAETYFQAKHATRLAGDGIQVTNSSPKEFALDIRQGATDFPTMSGELISGKYSSVFPGTLSARVYSKLALEHSERLLYRYAEPLASLLPSDSYPSVPLQDHGKQLLQNLVHDVISGCSIDQVHEIAELRTQKLHTALRQVTQSALTATASTLQNGTYAFVPSTGASHIRGAVGSDLYDVAADGVSIVKLPEPTPLKDGTRPITTFKWKNRHFSCVLHPDGTLALAGGQFGRLVVRTEAGDTYWDEPRGEVTALTVEGPLKVSHESDNFAQVTFTASAKTPEYSVLAHVTLTLDDSPLAKWNIRLSTTGTGVSVLLRHTYPEAPSQLQVGMQFDTVERPFVDTDLMGRTLSPELASVLNASSQRDLDRTFTFPFQSFISPVLPKNRVHLLARGLRAYQTERPGHIDLVLSRPVDWLMKPSHHQYHSGDAGPKFYVPDARSQRKTSIDCALLITTKGPDHISFHQAVDQYLCDPLLFEVTGSTGTATGLPILQETAIISSLHTYKGTRVARLYNPTPTQLPLHRGQAALKLDQYTTGYIDHLAPKAIQAVALDLDQDIEPDAHLPTVNILNWPSYPIGPDTSRPDPRMISRLSGMHDSRQRELDTITASLNNLGENAPSTLQHRYYVTARECMEARLSLLWNQRRADRPQTLEADYALAVDEHIYELATRYNDLRIMRRMYDYIIGVDTVGEPVARPARHLKTPPTSQY